MAAELEDELGDFVEDTALMEQARLQQEEQYVAQQRLLAVRIIEKAYKAYKFRRNLVNKKAANQSRSPDDAGNSFPDVKVHDYMDCTMCGVCGIKFQDQVDSKEQQVSCVLTMIC